jgi:membrane associated rhomboid family serine protease
MFNAPWPALALAASILGGYALQGFVSPALVEAYAFAPSDLQNGRFETLFTSIVLHGSWIHAFMNAGFALAFASPVARFFGGRPAEAAGFFIFYLACGALAGLGFALAHWQSPGGLVGASGAVSGLMGAAARLMGGQGRPGPLLSRPVLALGGGWLGVNLLLATLGVFPGAGDAQVAWEAHIAGFVAGVLLFGPFARIWRRA